MIKWFKRKMGLLAIALARVEKQALKQASDAVGENEAMSQTYHQGTLSDALLKGEITMPVKELRWRLYKVLSASKGRIAKITGYDDDGLPIVNTYNLEKFKLDKVSRDNFDPYDVELSIENEDITKSILDGFSNENLNEIDEHKIDDYDSGKFDLVGADVFEDSRTIAEISFDKMISTLKSKKTIFIERELRPKFEIESYTKKLLVRKINEEEKLLEFYLSLYPDEYDRKTRLLINEIKKINENPRCSSLININKVIFITDGAIGAKDGLEYEYEILKFDKVVEFNGFYVIKFIAKSIINGENIFKKYKLDELELKYKNKEAK
jgi:hypothetical protein